MIRKHRSLAPWLGVVAVTLALAGCFKNPTDPFGSSPLTGGNNGGGGTTVSNMSDNTTTSISATASVSTRGIYLSVAYQLGDAVGAAGFGGGNLQVTYNNKVIPSGSIQLQTSSSSGQAISSSLVLDYSGSMSSTNITDMELAANTFINNMQAADRGEIIKFDDTVVVEQAYTADKAALHTAVAAHPNNYGGSTALFDAIYRGILDTTTETGQRAVVAFTDGGENASVLISSETALISQARSRGIPIYTIGLGSYYDQSLTDIALQTGGRFYAAPDSSQLAQIYSQIAQLFSNTMIITWPSFTYVPGASLRVTVTYICGTGTYTSTVDVVLP